MASVSITAIVLTKDEEQHLSRCLASIKDHCHEVIVVDSGSTDRTEEIALAESARFVFNPWVNHAEQFNFGASLASGGSTWIMRIDADELLEEGWYSKLEEVLERRPDLSGFAFQRTIKYRGKAIRFGLTRTWQTRLYRKGAGHCEVRWMDEHIVVDGSIANLAVELVDDNKNDIRWWTEKHLGYADRGAIDLLGPAQEMQDDHSMTKQARLKRMLKNSIYRRLPPALRASLFFLVRYVFCLGFLDGRRGFEFHFLQGWWYRLYTDLRVREIERVMAEGAPFEVAVREVTGIDLSARGAAEADNQSVGNQ